MTEDREQLQQVLSDLENEYAEAVSQGASASRLGFLDRLMDDIRAAAKGAYTIYATPDDLKGPRLANAKEAISGKSSVTL